MAINNPLGSLFGRSPIRPIQEHMQIAADTAALLPDLIQASIEEDAERLRDIFQNVSRAEREADKLKRSIRKYLPKSLFLPVPRGDLLELISIQDTVPNLTKDISGLIHSRNMRFPDKLHKGLIEFTSTCVATVEQALTAIQTLDELLEVGFTGREVKRVEGLLKELDKLEGRTDKQAEKLRMTLFKLESDLPPVDVMFYYSVLAMLSELADAAEKVGDRLQILIAK